MVAGTGNRARRRRQGNATSAIPTAPATADQTSYDDVGRSVARRRRGGTRSDIVAGAMPTLPEATNQMSSPTESTNNNNTRRSVDRRRRGGGTPTLPEATNQLLSPTEYTNNNNHTGRCDQAGPNIGRRDLPGTQRVARYSRDTKCSCESCTLRSSGNASIKKWQDSDAKAHLRDLLLSNKQHKYWNDPPARVYDDNKPLFHLYKYENFSNNLRSLKKGITSEQENVDFDEAALDRESIAFPRGQITNHGNPFYDTSETKKLLVGLAKEGKLEQYKHHPSILMETNPIFHEYSGKVFAKAVNREKRRVKETVGWQMKRNIQGSKKHNAKYDKVQTAGE